MNESRKLQQIIFANGDSYFKSLLIDIAAAQHKIDLETYIFNPDSLGEQVVQALKTAAKRGVKIRVLVDGAGSPVWSGSFAKQLEKVGIETRIFHPLPWNLGQWSRSHVHATYLLKAIYLLLKINSRNHRKVCIIDNKIAYVGSANISKVHLSNQMGGNNWRDTGIKITGINLSELRAAFNAAWEHLPIKERLQKIFSHIDRNPVIRLNNSRHRRRILYKNLLNRIEHCQNRIWMTNAYFVPDNFLLKNLKDAANRGVDVRILLPQKSDIFFMPWASATFYRSLLKAGARIFEYLPSMLHTKVLILDDWIAIGSSNLNHRSLLHDLEVDINIRTAKAKFEIEQQFLADLKNSQEVFLSQWYKRPWYQRFLGKLLLYVKYWI